MPLLAVVRFLKLHNTVTPRPVARPKLFVSPCRLIENPGKLKVTVPIERLSLMLEIDSQSRENNRSPIQIEKQDNQRVDILSVSIWHTTVTIVPKSSPVI